TRPGHLPELVELNQVGVPEPRDGPGLLKKSLPQQRVGAAVVAQELDRHLAAQRHLPGLEDHPHPPPAQDAYQLQTRNARPVRRPPGVGVRAAVRGSGVRERWVLGLPAGFLGVFGRNGVAVALPAGTVERDQFPEQEFAREAVTVAQVARDARYRATRLHVFPRPFESVAD